jgi:GNAT superfamily N-acetyltransferase
MRSGPEPFDSPDVAALCAAQQEEMHELYGEADIGPARDGRMFEAPDGVFLVVRDGGGRALACGVARFDETCGELKRMYVVPDARGRGVGKSLLAHLAKGAEANDCGRLEWVTAISNDKGLAFYRQNGAQVQERVRVLRINQQDLSLLAGGAT